MHGEGFVSDARWATRLARPFEVFEIQRIGLEADLRFEQIGHPELSGETIPDDAAERAIREGRLWVVERDADVVGWAVVGRLEGELVVGQISVLQRAGREGAGTALLLALVANARAGGEKSIVLNTQSDVPWNAPWYAKHGFVVVPPSAWNDSLRRLTEAQKQGGVDWSKRVHMRLTLRS